MSDFSDVVERIRQRREEGRVDLPTSTITPVSSMVSPPPPRPPGPRPVPRRRIPIMFFCSTIAVLTVIVALILAVINHNEYDTTKKSPLTTVFPGTPTAPTGAVPKGGTQADTTTGSFSGVITVSGFVAGTPTTPATVNGAPVDNESLQVDPVSTGVANVVVFVDGIIPSNIPAPPTTPVLSTIAEGQVTPRICVVQVGQALQVTNNDAPTLTLRTIPQKNTATTTIIAPGKDVTINYLVSERIPVPVQADEQPRIKAYHVISDHPWVAVTDAKGTFKIQGLPPGTYTYRMWHEKMPTLVQQSLPLVVSGGKNSPSDFAISPFYVIP
ncbi:MAG: hypothetical protein ACKV0T_20825 [Planctomycetales bacterium]